MLRKIAEKIKYLYTEYKKFGAQHALKIVLDIYFRISQIIFLYFTKMKPLKNIIIIESHNDFDCNGGAFYNYLIKNNYNEKYLIVWLLKNKKKANQKNCLKM